MKNLKRLIAFAIALVMVFGFAPNGLISHVHAVETEDDQTESTFDVTAPHCVCGGAAEGMPGHTCAEVEWTEWNNKESLPTTTGNYYLTVDVNCGNNALSSAVNINLDLNGYTIKNTAYIYQTSSTNTTEVNICIMDNTGSGVIDASSSTSGQGGIAQVGKSMTLSIYGGTYIGRMNATYGGAFYSNWGGTFNMYGGEIYGGTATNNGDNLFVGGTGIANLYGGTIYGGIAYTGSTNSVAFSGSFAVSKYLKDGTTAVPYQYRTGSSNFVNYEVSCFCRSTDGTHADYCLGATAWLPWTSTTTLPTSGNYYLSDNVQVSAGYTIVGNLVLDLNGKTVSCDKTKTGNIYSTGSTYTGLSVSFMDSVGSGMIDASSMDRGRVMQVYGDKTNTVQNTVNIYGGTYKGTSANSSDSYGGVFQVNNQGVLNMYGGTVYGGTADTNGDNIFCGGTGTLNISGGTVYGGKNKAAVATTGGAVTLSGSVKILSQLAPDSTEYGHGFVTKSGCVTIGELTDDALIVANATGYVGATAVTSKTYYPQIVYKSDLGCASYIAKYDGTNIQLTAGRKNCLCGAYVSGGDHSANCDQKLLCWEAHTNTKGLPSGSGNYYLTENVTLSTTGFYAVTADKVLSIDLNGMSVTSAFNSGSSAGNYFNIFRISTNNATLNITDTVGTGVINAPTRNGTGSVVNINGNNSKFNLWGGTINGSTMTEATGSDLGGPLNISQIGENIPEGSSINIYGGTIKGLTSVGVYTNATTAPETYDYTYNYITKVDNVDVTTTYYTTRVADATIVASCVQIMKGNSLNVYIPCEQAFDTDLVAVKINDGATYTTPEHSYVSVATAPTCTEAGYTTYTCVCGDSYTVEGGSATGHDWYNGVCKNDCGTICETHDWSNGVCNVCKLECEHVSDAEYPCQDGNCEYCGEDVPATSEHVYPYECVKFCDNCGHKRVVDDDVTHVDDQKDHICDVCTEIIYHNNWGDWREVEAATCTKDGSMARTCLTCGVEQTEVIEASHIFNERNHCSRCGVMNPEATAVAMIGDTPYADILVAFAFAEEGDTVTLLVDATFTGNTTLTPGVTYVIPEGLTLTVAQGASITADAASVLNCYGTIVVAGTADISKLVYGPVGTATFGACGGKLTVKATGTVKMLDSWVTVWTPANDAQHGNMLTDCENGAQITIVDYVWNLTDGTWVHAGHFGGNATCEELAVCEYCGVTYGDLADHDYVGGYCAVCEGKDPDATFVAKVGEKEYVTLADAIAAANAGDTVTLIGTVNLDASGVEIAKNLTIDLNDETVNSLGDVFVCTAGTLTITGVGYVNAETDNSGSSVAVWANGGNVIIDGGTWSCGGDDTTEDYDHLNDVIYVGKLGGTIVIKSGYFKYTENVWTLNENDNHRGTLKVYGGTFEKFDPSNSIAQAHGDPSFVAEGYKVEVNGDEYTVVELPEKVATNTRFDEELSLIVYYDFESSPIDAGYVAKLEKDGKTIELTNWAVDNDGDWAVELTGISAKEIADVYTITIYDGENAISKTQEVSLRAYAIAVLENDSSSAVYKTAMIDMLNYAAAAQAKFNYNTDNPANAGLDAYQSQATQNMQSVTNDRDTEIGEVFDGSNVRFNDAINILFYFKGISLDTYAEFSWTNNNGKVCTYTVESKDYQVDGESYVVELDGQLDVADARCKITCTIKNTDGSTVIAVVDSVSSNVARVLAKDGSTYKTLYESFMKYADATKAYLDAKNQ